jgi:hypothetical protein
MNPDHRRIPFFVNRSHLVANGSKGAKKRQSNTGKFRQNPSIYLDPLAYWFWVRVPANPVISPWRPLRRQ